MRLIGTVTSEAVAAQFCAYLRAKGIDHSCDVQFDPATGGMSYAVWAHDEDRMQEAEQRWAEFQANPSIAPAVEAVAAEPVEVQEEVAAPASIHVTRFFLSLCVLVFLLNLFQEWPLREEGLSEETFFITPVQEQLFFDIPAPIEKLSALVEQYGAKPTPLPAAAQEEIAKIATTPYWRGAYDWVVLKLQGKDTALMEGPLFEKIREGEVWRLFSPAILHTQLLHLLFNMMWLWMLGKAIEQRIGAWRTLLMTLVIGIGSNTLQYLMGGPFFLGYSGIVTGQAAFIWLREKRAPWEGYPVQPSTFLFLALFVFAIVALQLVSFGLTLFTTIQFSPRIANTAHVSGALLGGALALLPFFSSRVKRR